MKKVVIGILAHVDAGKTTLAESMLFLSGKIRRIGRVDNKDAYLDTDNLEKSRGITIFSKQAVLNFDNLEITLLDTPGHVDFSAAMERTLQVLDYAILVISGADGIQSHTRTLWKLLEIYKIPTFIFVNKMDQNGTDRIQVTENLKNELSDCCVVFDSGDQMELFEQLALCDEKVMENYLDSDLVSKEDIQSLIAQRKTFPVYFGSALRQEGIKTFLKGIRKYSINKKYSKMFAAKVFKITRDSQGNRLTHLKVTGGTIKVKDVIKFGDKEEKINEIRIYSGEKYKSASKMEAGTVCAVTGLTSTQAGEGLGHETITKDPLLEPVLSYHLILPEGVDERQLLPNLRELEEEEPELKIVWDEILKVIIVQIMGPVQIEILQSIIKERFGVLVEFGEGKIIYKETIRTIVEGVGHFEPLRHYAEVHLLLEPGERGSGLKFDTICREDSLDKNWQRLILSHLREKEHIGVLTGSYITDMKVTLVSGRAHNKHTVGGDFRQATFRALRQGLKEAECVLLEPYYSFKLELPEQYLGRAMTDIDKMHGKCKIDQSNSEITVLSGIVPVSTMKNYQHDINSYTKGFGKLSISVKGYDVCHNSDFVIENIGYDDERDIANPTGSVFCSGGSGYLVAWDKVKENMHIESFLKPKKNIEVKKSKLDNLKSEDFISLEEIDSIMKSTYYSNQGKKSDWKKKSAKESYYEALTYKGSSKNKSGEEFLLVDGYNIIFAWPELDILAKENLEVARSKLIDILSNYQAIRKCHIMLVFDAYRVEGGKESVEIYHNIHLVFTAEAQTADQYIEKFAHSNKNKYRIIVATSDGLQQIIIRGAGADLLSARELREDVIEAQDKLNKEYLSKKNTSSTKLEDIIGVEDKEKLKKNGK